MPNTKVCEAQVPVDIALQQYGNFSSVFDFADLNGISITDLLPVNSIVKAGDPVDEAITNLYIQRWQKPASGYEDNDILSAEGLDYWAIELDFIIT